MCIYALIVLFLQYYVIVQYRKYKHTYLAIYRNQFIRCTIYIIYRVAIINRYCTDKEQTIGSNHQTGASHYSVSIYSRAPSKNSYPHFDKVIKTDLI